MKNIILIGLFYYTGCAISFAQCDNNVSTDYNKTPTNNALPTNSPQPVYGEKFLNEFNWLPKSVNQTLAKYQTVGLSPNLLDAGEIQNIYSNQQDSYYSYLFNDLEPSPQNGWELISVNMGYFPNGEVQNPTSEFTDFPYLILYNKYKSILRVFGLLGPGYADYGGSIDVVVVKAELEGNNENGLFRLSEGTDKTLDQPTEFSRMASVTHHQNKKGRWFSADFQVAYDPCVCYFDSKIRFNFDFVETAFDFDAQINSISLEEDLITNNSGLADSDFLNSFDYTDPNSEGEYGASDGYLIYNAIDNLLENYDNELEAYEDSIEAIGEHNKQVTRRKWIVKAGRFVLQAGTFALTGGVSGGGTTALELKTFLPMVAPDLLKSEDELSKLVLSELKKLLGKGSKMLISEWVGEEINPEDLDQPIRPSATFTQSTMRGTIQRTVDFYGGPSLWTPGSYGGDYSGSDDPISTPHEYPVYNEALGVFALLRKPTIKIYSDTENDVCTIETEEVNPGESLTSYNLEYINNTQWSIDQELKYVINPVLDIKETKILAAIELEGINQLQEEDVLNLQITDSVDSKQLVNAESISMEFEEGSNHAQELVKSITVISDYFPIDAFQNITSQMSYRVKRNIPATISNFNNFCEENLSEFEITGAKLKLIVNITFEGEKSNGSPHDYTYLFTYKIDPNDIDHSATSPLFPNLSGSQGNISQYPENLFLNGETFDGSPVDGCQLNGNTYLCKAWNEVELSGEFTVANNYEVIVEGGEQVTVLPESETPPEMSWQVVPVLDYSNPLPPVDASYISSFCQNSNEYQARQGTKSLLTTVEDSTTTQEERISDNFAFNIYPNPTSGRTTVSITLDEAAQGELFITDINGRRLESAFNNRNIAAGQTEYQLPTQTLATGIYLVHLFVDGEHHVKRLIKN